MNTQYLTTTTSPALPAAEELVDIPSEHITGRKRRFRAVAEVCLRDETMRRFWIDTIRAVNADSRCEIDGEVFTSEDLDVYLGPYDMEVKHIYKWTENRGGDSYMGFCEGYADLEESFEVVSARDADYGENLPGLVAALNRFYAKNKLRLY